SLRQHLCLPQTHLDFVLVPVYFYPLNYPILPPHFYPQPSAMENDEDQCFLPSSQPSQHNQSILAKRKCTLIRNQDANDGARDINELLGGRATSPPEKVSPPEPESSPEPVTPEPEPQLVTDPPPTCLSWGEIMDVLDEDELEEAEKQKLASDLPPLPLSWGEVQEKRENFMEKKMKVSNEQKVELAKRKRTLDLPPETASPHEPMSQQKVELPAESRNLPADMTPYRNNTKGVELFIRSLDFAIDEQHLYKEFLPFGNIVHVKLMRKNDGRSNGYGYVSFSSEAEANAAVRVMNGKILGRIPLFVTLSKNKEKQAKQKMWSSRTTKPRPSNFKVSQRVRPQ
ncbi:hypothetical protein QTP86_014783, partial [Hemibagrus guttatus]